MQYWSKINLKPLKNVKGQTMVDYIGDGEVLDVLNTQKDGKIALEIDKNENIITDENYIIYPTSYEVQKHGEAPAKELVLMFDDGQMKHIHPQVLDVFLKIMFPQFFFNWINSEKIYL